MDTDIDFTLGNSSRNTPADDDTVRSGHECGSTALTKNSIPENSYISDVHVDLATDTGDITPEEQGSIPMCSQGHPDTPTAGDRMNDEHDGRKSQDTLNGVVLAAVSEEVHLPELQVVPVSESRSAIEFDGLEVPTIIRSQEPLLLCWQSAPETKRDDEEQKTDPDVGTYRLDTVAGREHGADLACLTHEEDTREGFDQSCNYLPSSQPPSSSPPQLFSSSPCASSQSSVGDIEPSKTGDFEVEISECTRDGSHTEDVEPTQDESYSASEHHDRDILDAIVSTEITEHHTEVNPTPRGRSLEPPKKREVYQIDDDPPYGRQETKRLKPGSHSHPPPAPMRATLASQSQQFKKLAAPFHPPSKLPVARDKPVQTTNVIQSVEQNHDKPDQKELYEHVLRPQHKVSNTSRSVMQFKSPLINKVSSADTRTIRLTPAVQALERKVQLLKRAIKVKQDEEEEVLTRLAAKWTEAGREVAYEVWDATKDAGNFGEKAVLTRRSYGWENTENGNASWGWDTKREDASEESRARDSSMAVCTEDPLAAEDDDEVGFHNTLGTMLRQLGIAPEIFGWDDDKEAFCD